jgi:hypothetical protein
VLQNRPAAAASITRVPAAEIEALVIMALRNHLQVNATEAQSALGNERKLVEHNLERVTLAPKRIKLQLRPIIDVAEASNAPDDAGQSPACPNRNATTLTIPWTSPVSATKGIIHVPAHNTPMKPSRREALLTAIANARKWVDDLGHGRVAGLAAIAHREGMVERRRQVIYSLW